MTVPTLNWSEAPGGWIEGASHCLSPNHDARPGGAADISLVVLHFISLPAGRFGGDAVLSLFQNLLHADPNPALRALSALRVSSHFFIRRDGTLIQCVAADQRAWHAGRSIWRGRPRCNDFAIGIELEGTEDCPFESPQYSVLDQLLTLIRQRYSINEIVGHEHIAPGRKVDPGPCFDWSRVDHR